MKGKMYLFYWKARTVVWNCLPNINEKTTPMLQTSAANDIYPFAVI